MVTLGQLIRQYGNAKLHFTGRHECTRKIGTRGGVKDQITRVRQTGMIKTWKTRPEEFRMPVKYGMYESWYVDETNADQFHLASECPLAEES